MSNRGLRYAERIKKIADSYEGIDFMRELLPQKTTLITVEASAWLEDGDIRYSEPVTVSTANIISCFMSLQRQALKAAGEIEDKARRELAVEAIKSMAYFK